MSRSSLWSVWMLSSILARSAPDWADASSGDRLRAASTSPASGPSKAATACLAEARSWVNCASMVGGEGVICVDELENDCRWSPRHA